MSDDPIARAKTVADAIRPVWPAKAAEIDRAIAAFQDGKRDGVTVKLGVRFKLEKFHADAPPGTLPYEVIEGDG